VTTVTVSTSPKLFVSNYSTTASMASLFNSCRRSETLSEITDSRFRSVTSKRVM